MTDFALSMPAATNPSAEIAGYNRLMTQPGARPAPDQMAQAAKDFEAVFLAEIIRPMIETIEVNDTFGGGKGEEIFRGMMVDEYGKIMAAAGGIGLASPVHKALIAAQQAAQGTKGEPE